MICVAFEEFVSVDIGDERSCELWGPIVNHFIAKNPHPPEWRISSTERPPHTMIPRISFRHPTGVSYLVRPSRAHPDSVVASLPVPFDKVEQPTALYFS